MKSYKVTVREKQLFYDEMIVNQYDHLVQCLVFEIPRMNDGLNVDDFNIHIETEIGNYEGGASLVLVLLSNYYSNKKLFDENRDGYGNILILKDASIISKSSIIPDLLKGDIVENNNIEYIKVCNIKISSDVELESDVDGDKSDKLPVDIKILGNHIEVFSGMKE